MKDQDLDKLFSEGFKDQEVTPPASVWEQIETQLDEQKVLPIQKRNKLFIWTIAASMLLALGITGSIFLMKDNSNQKQAEFAAKAPETTNDLEDKSETTLDISGEPKVQKEEIQVATVMPSRIKKPSIKSQTPELSKPDVEKESKLIVSVEKEQKRQTPILVKEMSLERNIELDEIDQEQIELSAVEVAPIQPLVNIIEKEDVMYAQSEEKPKKRQTIFTNILNTLTENLNPLDKSVKFSSDEEGNIKIDLHNSIAKTRR